MAAPNDAQVLSFAKWTLRVREATEGPARLLLLVHGWTGDENSMWVFVRDFPRTYWIVSPRGPYATKPAGFSWRPPQQGSHARPTYEDLKPAVDALLGFVDAYAAANQLESSQFDAIGFSQGAALVSLIALMRPERIGRVGVLSGFVPDGAEALAQARPLKGKPLFVAHGTLDEMVNIHVARQSVKVLQDAGANVTYCEDTVGHKLSVSCLRAMHAFFVQLGP